MYNYQVLLSNAHCGASEYYFDTLPAWFRVPQVMKKKKKNHLKIADSSPGRGKIFLYPDQHLTSHHEHDKVPVTCHYWSTILLLILPNDDDKDMTDVLQTDKKFQTYENCVCRVIDYLYIRSYKNCVVLMFCFCKM